MTNKLTQSPKKLLLIDGIGAIISAFFLGVILVRFQSFIGMPRQILQFLAVLPCLFAIYSFSNYFFHSGNRSTPLKVIAIANLSYCILTLALLFVNFGSLTVLGWLYFLIEITVICFLVALELKTSQSAK